MTSASDNLTTLVDDMLQDAGCGQDLELRGALLSLGALAALPAPAPTGELAALLAARAAAPAGNPGPAEAGSAAEPGKAGKHDGGEEPGDDLGRRRRRRHRPTALGLVLVAGMGLGVGGVAASSTVPYSNAVEHLLEEWVPWNGPSTAAPAATGHRVADPAAAAELADAASTAAPRGAGSQAGSPAFRLLRDPSGLSGPPACTGPLKHDSVAAACAGGAAPSGAGEVGAANNKDVAGASKEDRTPAAAAGTGAAAGTNASAGSSGAGTPAPNPAVGVDAGAWAQNAPGSADSAGQAQSPSQGAGQGDGQGNGRKGAAPTK